MKYWITREQFFFFFWRGQAERNAFSEAAQTKAEVGQRPSSGIPISRDFQRSLGLAEASRDEKHLSASCGRCAVWLRPPITISPMLVDSSNPAPNQSQSGASPGPRRLPRWGGMPSEELPKVRTGDWTVHTQAEKVKPSRSPKGPGLWPGPLARNPGVPVRRLHLPKPQQPQCAVPFAHTRVQFLPAAERYLKFVPGDHLCLFLSIRLEEQSKGITLCFRTCPSVSILWSMIGELAPSLNPFHQETFSLVNTMVHGLVTWVEGGASQEGLGCKQKEKDFFFHPKAVV